MLVVLITACGRFPSATATSPATPSPATTLASAGLATRSPSASDRGFRSGTSNEWPAVDVYVVDGSGIAHRHGAGDETVVGPVCSSPERVTSTWNARNALVACGVLPHQEELYRLVPRPQRVLTGAMESWTADMSPDGTLSVGFEVGPCVSPAPVCQEHVVLVDVASGARRVILPDGYHLGATVGWTALGLTFFQPECAEAGCSGVENAGTFVWDGKRFVRRSELRFIAKNGPWELYEKLRAFFINEPRQVVRRGPDGDVVLTPPGAAEHALAIDATGRVLAWRTTTGEDGEVVVYDAAGRERSVRAIAGVVTSVAGFLFTTVQGNSDLQVRLYDADQGVVFPVVGMLLGGASVRGAAIVLR